MHLALIASILLLVPLATTAKATPAPYFKLLFQDGYVVTEGSYRIRIDYYPVGNGFVIMTAEQNSIFAEWIFFKSRKAVKESAGFAVESYHTTQDFFLHDDESCRKNASEQLKPLILDCGNHVLLRLLTEEEKVQIEKYKKEQQESRKPFELVYDQTRVTSKANDLYKFHFEDNEHGSGEHRLYFWTRNNATGDLNSVYLLGKLASKSFTIEGLPADSEEKCGKNGSDDLIMTRCTGKIKVNERGDRSI